MVILDDWLIFLLSLSGTFYVEYSESLAYEVHTANCQHVAKVHYQRSIHLMVQISLS